MPGNRFGFRRTLVARRFVEPCRREAVPSSVSSICIAAPGFDDQRNDAGRIFLAAGGEHGRGDPAVVLGFDAAATRERERRRPRGCEEETEQHLPQDTPPVSPFQRSLFYWKARAEERERKPAERKARKSRRFQRPNLRSRVIAGGSRLQSLGIPRLSRKLLGRDWFRPPPRLPLRRAQRCAGNAIGSSTECSHEVEL